MNLSFLTTYLIYNLVVLRIGVVYFRVATDQTYLLVVKTANPAPSWCRVLPYEVVVIVATAPSSNASLFSPVRRSMDRFGNLFDWAQDKVDKDAYLADRTKQQQEEEKRRSCSNPEVVFDKSVKARLGWFLWSMRKHEIGELLTKSAALVFLFQIFGNRLKWTVSLRNRVVSAILDSSCVGHSFNCEPIHIVLTWV